MTNIKNNTVTYLNKPTLVFIVLSGVFICNALLAEFIGVKVFSFEQTMGIEPFDWSIFGMDNLSFNLSTGVLIWPVVFIMTDVINEYFGHRGVRIVSFLAVFLILYAFAVAYIAIQMQPADFWPKSHLLPSYTSSTRMQLEKDVGNLDQAFSLIFGQGLWIIAGSVIAFLVGQLVDVTVFHKIKAWTGEQKIWLRATGSTLVSQWIDSYIVLLIAFYFGAGWDLKLVLAIGTMNYIYKFVIAILITPLIYLAHFMIDNFLGKTTAETLKMQAKSKKI